MQADLGLLTAVLSIAQSQEWATVFKLGALVVIAEKATKVYIHVRKKRNGGTEYDKLAGINAKLDKHSEKFDTLIDLTREAKRDHERQAAALETIADEAKTTNGTIGAVVDLARAMAEQARGQR